MTKRIFLFTFSLLVALLISACDSFGGGNGGPSFKLTVNVSGNGTVTGSGIDCGSDCDETYNESTSVTLEANPASGETFEGWDGAGCTGTDACIVTVDSNKTVNARFTGGGGGGGDGPFLFRAFIEAGQGTLVSDDGNINCSSDADDDPANCTHEYDAGASVKITATPAAGFVAASGKTGNFNGSRCSLDPASDNICTYSMTDDRDSRISFIPEGADIFTVTENSDDAEEYTSTDGAFTAGTVVVDSSDLELNHDEGAGNGVNQLVGIRFTEVTVDATKTVSEIYIEFTPKTNDATEPNLKIQAEANVAPATFDDVNNNISSRTLTTDSVDWTPAAWSTNSVTDDTRTPNLLSLMTAAGWTSGGDVAFIITPDGTDAQRQAWSRDGDSGKAPKLVIVYQ